MPSDFGTGQSGVKGIRTATITLERQATLAQTRIRWKGTFLVAIVATCLTSDVSNGVPSAVNPASSVNAGRHGINYFALFVFV